MSERRVAQGWKWLAHVLGIDGRTERRKRIDAVATQHERLVTGTQANLLKLYEMASQ